MLELDEIGTRIVDSAFSVHKNLGPGLLESIYVVCFCHELAKRNLNYEKQYPLQIKYDNIAFEEGLRIDVLVENQVVCEIKAVAEHNKLFEAQLMSYLKLANKNLGYLLNFNVPLIKDGIKRIKL